MHRIVRHAATGFAIGGLITALTLVAFPHFFSRVYEIAAFPLLGLAAGSVCGVIGGVLRIGRAGRRGQNVFGRPLMFALFAGIVFPLGLYAIRSPARTWTVDPKLVVLCIDGGTWDIIDPLIADGKLPNLARLKREGTSAVLMSTEPAFSMIVWTTIGAGVTPEKHGIQSFYDTQDHLEQKRFWEVFEDNGHSIGLFRWWITWPPRVKNGFVIPDILARDASSLPPRYDFINQFRLDAKSGRPIPLGRKIATGWAFLSSGLRFKTCVEIARELWPAFRSGRYADRHIASRRAEIRLNADMYGHLLRVFQPEYTCFYDNGADQLCHFYWQYFDPASFSDLDPEDIKRYGSAIPDYYELNDAVIGRILRHIAPSSTIVVLSDHGFRADLAGANNWFFPRGVPIVSDLHLDDAYYSIALGSRTFIESVRRDPAEKHAALERALALVNSLEVEESGVPLFSAWIEQEERVQLDVSDSLRTLEGHVRTPGGLVPLSEWFTTRVFGGTHDPRGIFIAKGDAYRRGHSGVTGHVLDIAPTILRAAGFPLSRELDGTVMWDWLRGVAADSVAVAWIDTYGRYDPARRDVEVDEKTLERLRSLGYIR